MSDTPDIDSNIRPDPFFKQLTRSEAIQLGLTVAATEQQFSTLADIVLIVPPGVSLEETLFDFCRTENIIEFKSENDQLTLAEFVRNSIRTEVSFLSRQEPDFAKILNVIVSSREPQAFLEQAVAHGIQFQAEPGQRWLLRGRVGFQDVVIIVCRLLPLDRRYYPWLIFAPTNSRKWKRLADEAIENDDRELLLLLQKVRPQ